ncbi:thiamine phosphate synthase [Candidatus Methanomassiliicoccus intestinalis]|uniref:Thiamine-phosphate synthase n=1 Tax=Methanomassiliicoccus intestinalis (strain Issoire-Mx1) TaxID=1295009 RepID=R9TC46_METII|nr:thiamine phosphate synthase [Candidatus Methanomassiliicoccus intestinalis]AGN27033.1 thiamine-phosphate pyrophosphorylase ThiE2 [Candidatus Methanomassiliicoccus intestinalis Issoire-Mx1]TQS80991.1 MAG: thiamine phosphate synthase [Candidatus Methanomassiliicoccus intestinalis]
MKFTKESLKLYVITDRSWIGNRSMSEEVEKTLKAGATCLQIREKNISYDEYVSKSIELRKICNKYNVPFIVNDNIEVALASGADGVHVGQNDILNKNVRSIIGSDKILGISVNSIELAIAAEKAGADYIGVGSIQLSPTKGESKILSTEYVNEICNSVSIPVVAIGGINEQNIPILKGIGIAGVAVISAVFGKEDVAEATYKLRKLVDEYI